ncbi:MAG: type III secretion system chaperone [Opitutales bacterium]|nr:type III secretion system chaperone [Opitutales bacterium]
MSSSRLKMEAALNNLASRLHLDSLTLNDRNECYLMFDQQFHVRCSFKEDTDECVLYSSVGRVRKGSVDAYTKILSDNFFWVGTAGSKLLLEPLEGDEDNLALCEHVPMSMFDEERLYERMEDFVNAVEYWTTEYPKLQQGGASSSPSSTGSSSGTSSDSASYSAPENMGMFQA